MGAYTTERLIYEKALPGLQAMNPTDAYKAIVNQSGYKRSIFLVAEEDGLNRSSILGKFPRVPEEMKEKLHAR